MNTLTITEHTMADGQPLTHHITSQEQWNTFVVERCAYAYEHHQELVKDYETEHTWDTEEQFLTHLTNLYGYLDKVGLAYWIQLWNRIDHSCDHYLSGVFEIEDTYDLHINALTEGEDIETFSHQVSGSALVSAIDNFGARDRGWGNEIELEDTDQSARVLMDLGINLPNADAYYVVARPQ